ncbi:hypothetical protein SCLCIDRAFT_855353 [Scleroderma citrinum Foug A]|uniref:Uncharacterized protein n=1 Tax=Scleroderma citrinum Foug A TaxID=1036808 RepID=A0A0C3D1Z7_9AGAM|nr:hypothetical protein SCLCIDRAFT_855353 [Scleroderma citrinum Foug A]
MAIVENASRNWTESSRILVPPRPAFVSNGVFAGETKIGDKYYIRRTRKLMTFLCSSSIGQVVRLWQRLFHDFTSVTTSSRIDLRRGALRPQ